MKHFCGFVFVLMILTGTIPALADSLTKTPEEELAATEALTPMQIVAQAAAGAPAAQYLLGRNALFGPEEDRSAEDAWFWIHGAADMNFPPAQFLMAYLCHDGIWMAKNQESAHDWLELAAKNGNAMAMRVLNGASFNEVLKAWLPAKN